MKILMKDEIFEQAMAQRLDEARGLAQTVLNEWNSLGLGSVNGHVALYEIIHQPEIPFKEAENRLKTPPEGIDPKLAADHVASVKIPFPERLYKASEIAKRNGYMLRELALFNIDKGGAKVQLNEKVAKGITTSRTVYSENEAQEKYFAELQSLIEQLNRLNKQAQGKLLTDNSRKLGDIFLTPARQIDGYYDVQIEPSALRILLQQLK